MREMLSTVYSASIEYLLHLIWCSIGCLVIWLTYRMGEWWCGGIASVVYFYALYFLYDWSSRRINRLFNVVLKIKK